jgi:hypothetical protein
MCGCDCYDNRVLSDRRRHRATKEHHCYKCGTTICKEQTYDRYFIVSDEGLAHTFKVCDRYEDIDSYLRETLKCFCPEFETLFDEINEIGELPEGLITAHKCWLSQEDKAWNVQDS